MLWHELKKGLLYVYRGRDPEGGREGGREGGEHCRYIIYSGATHTYREMAAQYLHNMCEVSRGKTEDTNSVQGRAGEGGGGGDEETSAQITHGSGHT